MCPCPKVNVKDEIMYFLVNASPPKPLDVATSNFADKMRVFAMVYHRLKSSYTYNRYPEKVLLNSQNISYDGKQWK